MVSRFVPNRRNIARITLPGGIVARDADRLARRIQSSARRQAPVGSGRMARSISSDVDYSTTGRVDIEVSVNVPYAAAVLGGTGPQPNAGKKPIAQALGQRGVPVGGLWAKGRPKSARPNGRVNRRPGRFNANPPNVWFTSGRTIRGQRANNFLGRALDTQMRRYQR